MIRVTKQQVLKWASSKGDMVIQELYSKGTEVNQGEELLFTKDQWVVLARKWKLPKLT